jgi:hypothetical protein
MGWQIVGTISPKVKMYFNDHSYHNDFYLGIFIAGITNTNAFCSQERII